LPAIFGSGLYELKELMEIGISSDQYINLILGILAAFVVGYFSIELLLRNPVCFCVFSGYMKITDLSDEHN